MDVGGGKKHVNMDPHMQNDSKSTSLDKSKMTKAVNFSVAVSGLTRMRHSCGLSSESSIQKEQELSPGHGCRRS